MKCFWHKMSLSCKFSLQNPKLVEYYRGVATPNR